jgi:16S rRNA processing protein RimM
VDEASDEVGEEGLVLVRLGDQLAWQAGLRAAALVGRGAVGDTEDRAAAEEFRGALVCLPREVLPEPDEDEYFLADLVGCIVHDAATGDAIGRATKAESLPANVVVTIKLDAGATVLAPLVTDAMPTVDVAARRIDLDVAFLGIGDPPEEPDA